MLKFKLILEDTNFTNWKKPNTDEMKLEYKVEYQLKGLSNYDWFPTVDDFILAIKKAKVIEVDKELDYTIRNRSRTRTKDELLNLIRNYASYPEFRNEKTIDNIYEGFKNNSPMTMPIVLKIGDKYRIFSGNTRMDIAFQLGINPKVIILPVEE